jgi:hypothetical protein
LALVSIPVHRGGVSAIEPTQLHKVSGPVRSATPSQHSAGALAALLLLTFMFLSFASLAYAGNASTGEIAFDPCTKCHPVTLGPDGKSTKPLPNGFKKHEIKLEAHDILGKGTQACVVCHDDPTKNPGMLLTADGTRVYVTGDVSRVCQRCHFAKYREWQAGIHGKRQPKCTSAGCHDPHTPSWIYVAALPPFQGTGVEVRAVGEREPFKPMASPPVQPPVYTPIWLSIMAAFGVVASAGIIGFLVLGRHKR